MKVSEVAEKLEAKVLHLGEDKTVESGYAGDFLSNVMGKAPEACAWLTVMNNVNVAAVALLADVAVIVLCEGVLPDDALLKRAKAEDINIISTKHAVFEASAIVHSAL